MKFRIAPIFAAIVLSLTTSTSSPPARAQEPDPKCGAAQLGAKLSSGVIPDMVGCALKPTLVVLRRFDHVPAVEKASGPPPAGIIVSQAPPAETPRRSDTPMTLTYSDGNAAAPNLSVSVTTEPSAPYKRGDVIRFWIVVRNNGNSPIPFARVSMQLTNMTIVNVNPTFPDACHELPCDLQEITPDANVSVFVRARIDETPFRSVITAIPRPLDAETADNSVIVEGEVPDSGETGTTSGNGPTNADISVAIKPDSNEAHPPNAPVTHLITIHNAGPQTATNVIIELAEDNLSLEEVTGACSTLPCTIPSIAPGDDASIQVLARVGNAGNFRSLVLATSENDPDESNNKSSYDGVIVSAAPPDDSDPSNTGADIPVGDDPTPTEIPWIWIVVSVIALIGAGVATHTIRKARWSRMIEVRPRIDPGGKTKIGPIEPVIPLEIRMRIDPGESESSPIDVRDA